MTLFNEYLNRNSDCAILLKIFFNKEPKIKFVNLNKLNQLVVLHYGKFYGTLEETL